MARVGGGGGPRWVWPLIIVLILLGLTVLAWALLAPQAPATQPSEQTAEEPAAAPATGGEVSIADLMADPYTYFGNQVTVEGRVTRTTGDRGVFLVGTDEGSGELMAVLDRPLAETELSVDDYGRFSGTVRLLPDDEGVLSDAEKVYLMVEDFEEVSR